MVNQSKHNIFYFNRDEMGNIIKNKQVGHMLRTKISDANEGGVAGGSGALDSVYLVDVERCCAMCEMCALHL